MDAIIHWVEQQICTMVGGAYNHISIVKPLHSSEVHIEGTTDIGKSSHSKRCTMTHYLQTWSNRIVKDRNTVTSLWTGLCELNYRKASCACSGIIGIFYVRELPSIANVVSWEL